MSNRDSEKDYSNLTDAIQFVFNQFIKDIFVSIPGTIVSYNSTTKRCRVKPAINILLTTGDTLSPSEIVNVPVLWPSGGGFSLLSPLPVGSPVEIKFSQRGITKFKESFSQADPGNGMFDKEDAHVIPSYGGLSVTPATEDGISMQSEDGTNYIFVEDGNVKIKATGKITIDAPEIEANAATKMDINTPILNVSNILHVNGLLNINAGMKVNNGTSYDSDFGDSIIIGTNVFNGADSDEHIHPQGTDSPSGDTQQDTGVAK